MCTTPFFLLYVFQKNSVVGLEILATFLTNDNQIEKKKP